MSRDSKEKAESTIPNPKSNSNVRLDSNGDEIVYEIRHHLTWWDYLMFSIFFPFGYFTIFFTNAKIDFMLQIVA